MSEEGWQQKTNLSKKKVAEPKSLGTRINVLVKRKGIIFRKLVVANLPILFPHAGQSLGRERQDTEQTPHSIFDQADQENLGNQETGQL